ncbi:uncharacterized protein ACA1_349840 [Acanthamoeba castellanii str. Neff]|uniref:Uncharacterized protein n=1 Tax=Acanthamoeba castellanii (strain ATCC 30010 / Neff) TaxID=1257118 RepID=L8GKC2_ACACF|nr:uncharacterized protein ACA1_349840 [Acanthamoeba castellanii str. Neff]ELR13163.1 hypothetical protein ACA1_349840 [Acanthamoeba castellanii str. Neff]
MHILWAQLQRLCRTGETDFLDLLLAESASLLKESAAFSSHHALVSESEHPHGTEDFVKEFAIPDAMGLVITFDRRCKLSDADSLTIYLDEKRTKPLRRFTGTSLSQFHPVVIASNRFWLQFQRQSGMPNNEPQWGYLMNVTPTNELLNLALWISEFLAEEADPVRSHTPTNYEHDDYEPMALEDDAEPPLGGLYSRLYVQLTQYLRTAKVPEVVKTVVLRLLKRLLMLAIDDFQAQWNKHGLRKGKRKITDKEDGGEAEATGGQQQQQPTAGSPRKSAEEAQAKRRGREGLKRDLQRFAQATAVLEDELFCLLCEVDLLHSPYLQNLAELIVLKRKMALLATASVEENIALDALSFYPASLDDVPDSFPASLTLSASESVMTQSAVSEGIRNFNAMAALDEVLGCFFSDKDFPRAFLAESRWNPRSLFLGKHAQLSSVRDYSPLAPPLPLISARSCAHFYYYYCSILFSSWLCS